MPTSQQVQIVIDNLKKVLPLAQAENHLDMGEDSVNNFRYKCGTVHCHGGWYAIAVCDLESNYISYIDGAKQMARDLGFKYAIELEVWADENKWIWGNNMGYYMFSSPRAFFSFHIRSGGAKTLQDIVDHWEDVKQRLIEKERQ